MAGTASPQPMTPPLRRRSLASLAVAALLLSTACAARVGPALADAETTVRVKTALLNDPVVGTEDVRVEVVNGVAFLTGRISAPDREARIVELTRATPGVSDVRVAFNVAPELAVVKRRLSVEPPEERRAPHLIGLGGGVRFAGSPGSGVDDVLDVTPLIRLGRGDGFGPAIGLGWTTRSLVDGPTGAPALAALRIRPLMGGVAYTRTVGRASTSLSLVAGYAFNGIRVERDEAGPFRAIAAANSLVWRPSASLWYEWTDRVGIQLSVGYLRARPRVTFASDTAVRSQRVNGDAVMVSIGAAYWIF